MNRPTVAALLGAGASADCWDGHVGLTDPEWKPPLVKELFSRTAYWRFTVAYPKARILLLDLMHDSEKGELNLEQRLFQYATHAVDDVRDQFKELPLYIRDVLAHTRAYVDYAGSHIKFFQEFLTYGQNNLAVLTTNYDTIVERTLGQFDSDLAYSDLNSLTANRRVKLFKLHGSVDWITPMSAPLPNGAESLEAWERALSDFDVVRAQPGRSVIRDPTDRGVSRGWWSIAEGSSFPMYPVLTAPLAGKGDNDVVCPPEHMDVLREVLPTCRRFVVAGTSGLDSDVMELLSRYSGDEIAIIHFVGTDVHDAEVIRARFLQGVPKWAAVPSIACSSRGFQEYAFSTELRDLAQLQGV